MCRLETGGLAWRVVAVDNASTDATPQILRSYEGRLPLTNLHESRRGKNYAMNCGLDVITSDLVLCIDDDVVLNPRWLLAVKGAFDAHPEFDIVCGPVEPLWPSAVPDWLLDVIPGAPAYSITPPGVAEGLCSPRLVSGPNMSFRMAIFRAGYRFNPAVGTDGTRFYAMGSDTEFTLRVAAAGH
jgi:glycosyltransferase involved in cell wall biosynthesis